MVQQCFAVDTFSNLTNMSTIVFREIPFYLGRTLQDYEYLSWLWLLLSYSYLQTMAICSCHVLHPASHKVLFYTQIPSGNVQSGRLESYYSNLI